ncbi:MAG: response regulator [Pseudomonadota bacterium]|nr:response regulator [Pseudomonadota bacterium]
MRLLLVEDDPLLGKATRTGLEQDGYAIDWVHDGASAESALLTHVYDAILLDLGLPGVDGITLLKELRRKGHLMPVLIITARDGVPDRITGLDSGADDFIIKPFDLDELAARLRAAIRRGSGRAQALIEHGRLVVDPAGHTAQLDGAALSLTAREFAVLLALLQHRGQVLSRARLEESLYGWGEEIESNALEVYVHHLRRKIGRDLIRTVNRVGYCIDRPGNGD